MTTSALVRHRGVAASDGWFRSKDAAVDLGPSSGPPGLSGRVASGVVASGGVVSGPPGGGAGALLISIPAVDEHASNDAKAFARLDQFVALAESNNIDIEHIIESITCKVSLAWLARGQDIPGAGPVGSSRGDSAGDQLMPREFFRIDGVDSLLRGASRASISGRRFDPAPALLRIP